MKLIAVLKRNALAFDCVHEMISALSMTLSLIIQEMILDFKSATF